MAAIRKYGDSDVDVTYRPEDSILILKAKKKNKLSKLSNLEQKIKTIISVDTSTKDPNGFTLKLAPKEVLNPETVHELLLGLFEGGSEISDAEDMASVATQSPSVPPPPGMIPQTESMNIVHAFEILSESTYRSAEYWKDLAQATGKPKQEITETDILNIRKVFSKKRRSAFRDKVLRATDSAVRYFSRKLRRLQGDEAARMFRTRYHKLSTLTPDDYSDKSLDKEDEEIQADDVQSSEPPVIDFSSLFKK